MQLFRRALPNINLFFFFLCGGGGGGPPPPANSRQSGLMREIISQTCMETTAEFFHRDRFTVGVARPGGSDWGVTDSMLSSWPAKR